MDQRIASLNGIVDPAQRAVQALATIEAGRTLMEKASEVRARAVFEMYQVHGAAAAARLLGISRVNLYRIIGQVPEVRQQRTARNLQVATLALTTLSAMAAAGEQESEEVIKDAIQ